MEQLRSQAEHALRHSHRRQTITPLLNRILNLCDEGSEDAVFAHHHLAECLLEQNPWQAALHLRKVIRVGADDDTTHALLGLCFALLRHFRASVSAYRRALNTSPHNPWYHHNCGHLLDVALDEPELAEAHLRRAASLHGEDHEIQASLAHCLARCQQYGEAQQCIRKALSLEPKHRTHKLVRDWIKQRVQGKSIESPFMKAEYQTTLGADQQGEESAEQTQERSESAQKSWLLVYAAMMHANAAFPRITIAEKVWHDFVDAHEGRPVRVRSASVCAAALECIADHVTNSENDRYDEQKKVIARYHANRRSVSQRFDQICQVLELEPNDTRYV